MRLRVSRIPRSTPLGRRAGLIGLGLLIAGFNTGNNLFYLFFTLLASSELVGFLATGRALRSLEVEVSAPRRGRVGTPMRATVRLRNRSSWLPLPALRWRLRTERGEEGLAITPVLLPGAEGTGTGAVVPARRGWLAIEAVEVRTDFPLGLALRSARLHTPKVGTLVLPRAETDRTHAARRRGDDRAAAFSSRSAGEDPSDARDYRAGDDARRIDWKATARTERLILRERRGDPPRACEVRLDRSGPPGPRFEHRVSRAAGAAADALRSGAPIAFTSDEWTLRPRAGPAQYRRILDYLSRVEATGDRRRT